MKFRLLALFIMLMTLGFGAVAQAQDISAILCNGLSGDDCSVLTTAFANTSALTSGAMKFTMGLNVDSPNPAEKVDFSIDANLRFTGAQGLGVLGALSDPGSIITNPNGMLSKVTSGLQDADAELSLNVGLPQQAAMMTGGGSEVGLELKVVDSVTYINFDALVAGLGPQMAQMFQLPSGWAQIDTTGSEEMIGAFTSGLDLDSMTQSASGAANAEQITQMQASIVKYYRMTRDGNTFTLSLDLAGLFSDPEFQKAMEAADAGTAPTEEQIAALREFPLNVLFTVTDDGYLGGVSFDVTLTEAWIKAMQTEPTSSSLPTSVQVQINLAMSDFNQVGAIAAPEGAQVVNLAELISQGFGAMMGGMSN